MSYTNGFNISELTAALAGRIGWRQPTEPGFAVVDADNLLAGTGRYFDSFHSLVNVKNVKDTAPGAGMNDAQLNTHLANIRKDAALRCFAGIFNQPEFFEKVLLFDREGNNDISINNSGLFVGYEFKVANKIDVSVVADSVRLLFDGDATFNLHLFKDGKKSPIKTVSVSVVANEASVISLTDFFMSYYASNTKGGRYYIGYFQDELGEAKAINEQVERWNSTLFFKAEPMQSIANDNGTDFNRNNIGWTWNTYGMNFEVTSFRDYTQLIKQRVNIFDEAIGLTVAYMVLEQILYCVRSNGTERILKEQADRFALQLDLNGAAAFPDSPQITGLSKRIERELERIHNTFYRVVRSQTVNTYTG